MSQISRRNMLKMLGASAAGVGFLSLAQSASAQTSPSSQDIVAYYRFNIGEFEAIIISDNTFAFPPTNLNVQGDAEETTEFFESRGLVGVDGNVRVSVNVMLVNNGDGWVLFDTGTGNRVLGTLEALGISPEEIGSVIISHVHGDHTGGLSAEGTLNFPNAQVYFPEPELDFFENGPDGSVGTARTTMAPALEADIVTYYADSEEIVSGVTAVAAHGHTPGHMAFSIQSGDATLMHFVDAVAHPIAGPANPEWAFGFDGDPEAAIAARRALMTTAAESGAQVFAYHFSFPGLGFITEDGESFRFVPAAF